MTRYGGQRIASTRAIDEQSSSAAAHPAAEQHPADSLRACNRDADAARTHMGRSAKVARIGNFATHKKNVQKRSLVVEKRPKKSRQTYATSKAPARAPKKAVRDAPKKK